jgi:hypothetical protein
VTVLASAVWLYSTAGGPSPRRCRHRCLDTVCHCRCSAPWIDGCHIPSLTLAIATFELHATATNFCMLLLPILHYGLRLCGCLKLLLVDVKTRSIPICVTVCYYYGATAMELGQHGSCQSTAVWSSSQGWKLGQGRSTRLSAACTGGDLGRRRS